MITLKNNNSYCATGSEFYVEDSVNRNYLFADVAIAFVWSSSSSYSSSLSSIEKNNYAMNGLSLSELCGLFCCPPFPSRIAAKLAFLPPEPSYRLIPDESGAKFSLELNERAEWQYTDREKENIEVFCTRTSRGNRIACMYVRCTSNNRFTILFSHGNAVDLGQMSSFYVGLGSRINCNIFSYDYSGKVNYMLLE